MRLTRILLLVVLALTVAGVVASSAAALRFEEGDCRESGPGGIWVCPSGTVGIAYSAQLRGAAGCGPDPGANNGLPYQYRVLSGNLPAGLSLSKSGLISGTPTAPGSSRFYVELSDEDPPSADWCRPAKAEREFTINVASALSIQQQSLAPTYVNEPYSLQLTAAGGGSQSWKVQSGTLPTGMTLSASGLLSGTPTTEGAYTFVVQVTDGSRSDIETLTLNVVSRLAASAPSSPAEVGVAFTTTVTATGGKGPYTWSLTGGSLPPGLALDPATGVISGTPSAAGAFSATLSVKDSLGLTASVDAPIAVAARLAISTKRLGVSKEGKRYSARVQTSGGVGKKTFKLRGKLPKGLKFKAATGVISGVPTQHGRFTINVEVRDGLGAFASQKLVLRVLA